MSSSGSRDLRRSGALLLVAFSAACIYACTSDYEGSNLPGDGSDASSAPVDPELGKPCVRQEDCASGVCVTVGTDDAGTIRSVCSVTCGRATDCIAGWSCAPATNRPDSVCSCLTAPETCDGRDNDCNGAIDDGTPASLCNSPTTKGAGWTCQAGACTCATPCPAPEGSGSICPDLQTDKDNCGACGTVCNVTACTAGGCRCGNAGTGAICGVSSSRETCLGDACQVSLVTEEGIKAFVAGDDEVFYATGGAPVVTSVKRRTAIGNLEDIAFPSSPVSALATNGQVVVFALEDGTIATCPQGGCSLTPTVLASQQGTVAHLRILDGVAYWAVGGEVRSCAVTGCGLAPTARVVRAGVGLTPTGLVVDATRIFAGYGDGVIMTVSLVGGAPNVFDSAYVKPLAQDATQVYWYTAANRVVSCPKAGCDATGPVLVTPVLGNAPVTMVVDATRIYWVRGATAPQNRVQTCVLPTCAVVTPIDTGTLKPIDLLDQTATTLFFGVSSASSGIEGIASITK